MARTLLRLRNLRLWVALGLVISLIAGVAGMKMFKKQVYAVATTQLLVDSPNSTLSNSSGNVGAYETLSSVFAQLMTSNEALTYIGKAAGIPGNLIEAIGPIPSDGSPQSIRMPQAVPGEPAPTAKPQYVLNLTQNPALPTIEVYTQAPTVKQAIALANGAGAGLTALIAHDGTTGTVPATDGVVVKALGAATGDMVDPGAGKSMAAIVFLFVFMIWCGALLWFTRVADQIRAERKRPATGDHDELDGHPAINAGSPTVRGSTGGTYSLIVRPRNGPPELRAPVNNGVSADSPAEPEPEPSPRH